MNGPAGKGGRPGGPGRRHPGPVCREGGPVVKRGKQEELKAVCSACFATVPVEQVHVQPGYNDDLKAYVTTYRCDGCRAADLAATRARMAGCTDPAELATGVTFFARYGVA